MAGPLVGMAITTALNIAKSILKLGVQGATKKHGSKAVSVVNKNLNALRKKYPDVLGPQKKARMSPDRKTLDKSTYMDEKGKFYSGDKGKELAAKAKKNRAALLAGPGTVVPTAGAVMLTGSPESDEKVVKPKSSKKIPRPGSSAHRRSKPNAPTPLRKPAPITEKKELKQAPVDKLRPGAVTQARKDELKREKAAESKRAQKRKEADRKATENKGPRTSRKKKVGKYDQGGEFQQSIQDFMKDKLGINVKFKEAEEEQDPGNNFAKGGFVTRKGPLYKRKSK